MASLSASIVMKEPQLSAYTAIYLYLDLYPNPYLYLYRCMYVICQMIIQKATPKCSNQQAIKMSPNPTRPSQRPWFGASSTRRPSHIPIAQKHRRYQHSSIHSSNQTGLLCTGSLIRCDKRRFCNRLSSLG